ncbi:MAG: hypothetical protein OCU18_07735 [Candidatus Syntrophoarchaeum sp.]|nr:hypothetical protein [Candidatus Syntrophoarchaeum sp.]
MLSEDLGVVRGIAFKRFISLKKQGWDDYQIPVTPYEIMKFLPVM